MKSFASLQFIVVSLIFSVLFLYSQEAYAQNGLNDQFSKYDIKTLDTDGLLASAESQLNGIQTFEIGGFTADLVPSDLYANEYVTTNSEGITNVTPSKAVPMNGFTPQGERVSLTFAEDFIYGYITVDGEKIFIEPAHLYDLTASKKDFVFYNEKDVKENAPKTCGVTELGNKVDKLNNAPANMVGLCYEVEYAIANDWSMIDKYGGNAGAEAHAIAVTNNVNTLYDTEFADEIKFVVTGQYNSTCITCDPWSSTTNANDLLTSFRSWALSNLSFAHDVASLWTDRDFDGSTIGLAYVGAVCSSFRYNILQDWSSNASLKQVMVTHELGHNLGSGHDAAGTSFVMSPSVTNTSTWSASSVTQVESYYGGISCLGSCTPQTPLIQFSTIASTTTELGGSGSTGACNEAYKTILVPVAMNTTTAGTNIVSISIDNSTTATAGRDFQLMTPTLTFTAGGALVRNAEIRIIDDKVEEINESIVLNLAVTSGSIGLGTNDQHTLDINDDQDIVSATCCSGGGEITYGNYNFYANTVFNGQFQDQKMRTLLSAADLTAAGLSAGFINSVSLNVVQKGSTGAFEDFRIGMALTSMTNLQNQPWISTTETFFGDVTSAVGWNDFALSTSFYWDGTSNLYVQFCFNNTAAVGADLLQHSSPLASTSGYLLQLQYANNTNGCSTSDISGTASYTSPIQPRMKFGQSGGAIVEITQGQSANTNLVVGETAHFYSPLEQVIVSITNTGNIDVGCISTTIATAGNTKINSNFGSGEYTQKTFNITSTNASATYDITLYYTGTELQAWGTEELTLSMVQSTVPLNQANESTVTISSPLHVQTNVGGSDQISYRGSFTGSGYFALTNVQEELVTGDLNVDFVINEQGRGILLSNDSGNTYRLSVNSSGQLVSSDTDGSPKACIQVGDLFLTNISRGVILTRPSGGYTKITVNTSGSIVTQNISSLPANHVRLDNGDFELEQNGRGIILKSSSGQCYRVFVNSVGTILTEFVNCQ